MPCAECAVMPAAANCSALTHSGGSAHKSRMSGSTFAFGSTPGSIRVAREGTAAS